MKKIYFELLSDPSSTTPCYFSDIETKEILYLNEPMKRLLNLSEEHPLGNKCYEVLQCGAYSSDLCPNTNKAVVPDEFREFRLYSNAIQSHIKCMKTVLTFEGRPIELCKCYEVNADFEIVEEEPFQKALERCVEIMGQKDRQEKIQSLLKLVGEYYQCDRSYFYIIDSRSQSPKEVFYWEHENAPVKLEIANDKQHQMAFFSWVKSGGHLQLLEMKMDPQFASNLPPEDIKIYQDHNYNNLTCCPSFTESGKLKTILGLLNRHRKTEQQGQSLLKIVAQFVDVSHVGDLQSGEVEGDTQYVDHLTNALTREKYHQILQILKFQTPKPVGVVFINVNGLKKTNQYYGLEAGDKLIQDSMVEAKKFFPLSWYRLSGDEFICFVTEWSEAQFKDTIGALHQALSNMKQRLFALGSAWGARTSDIDKYIETADTMMFIDKQTYYTDFDPNKMEFSDHVLQDLLMAVQEEEFLVYLQPKVDLTNDEVVGAEALIRRFNKKQNKMIFPDQFIPLYEKKSIIRHVDLFVLRKICILLQQWNQLGKKLKVSVNLSRVTLLEHGIVHKFAGICDDYNIPHEQIVVEVTERVGLIENEVESPLIEQFKHYGFTISLDDFGCAYSNIVTLATISVDEVKIDKSLVDNILTNPKNRTIVENMIRMVDGFGETSTLAEGVETKEQADCLRECNCRYVQGYLYSRPIPCDVFFEQYIKDSY